MKNKRLFQELIDMTTNVRDVEFSMNIFNPRDGGCGCVLHHGIKEGLVDFTEDSVVNMVEEIFKITKKDAAELFERDLFKSTKYNTPFDQAFIMQMYLDGHGAGCL